MDVKKLLSQGLVGLALTLAVGALLCAPMGELRADATPVKTPCDCTLDSCQLTPGGICCNGFCNCTDNGCGCGLWLNPDTGQMIPRCVV